MTAHDVQALADTAAGLILLHNGLWGAPECYMWAGADGDAAGRVPPWECEALDRLRRRKLVAPAPGSAVDDVPVVLTERGQTTLRAGHPRAA